MLLQKKATGTKFYNHNQWVFKHAINSQHMNKRSKNQSQKIIIKKKNIGQNFTTKLSLHEFNPNFSLPNFHYEIVFVKFLIKLRYLTKFLTKFESNFMSSILYLIFTNDKS